MENGIQSDAHRDRIYLYLCIYGVLSAKTLHCNRSGDVDALTAAHADDGHAQPQACAVEGLLKKPGSHAGAIRDDAPSSPDGVAARIGFKSGRPISFTVWVEQGVGQASMVDPVR